MLVYHGVGGGIAVYHDGNRIKSDTTRAGAPKPSGDGIVVVGVRVVDSLPKYASVFVDEVKFYNHQLTEEEMQTLH